MAGRRRGKKGLDRCSHRGKTTGRVLSREKKKRGKKPAIVSLIGLNSEEIEEGGKGEKNQAIIQNLPVRWGTTEKRGKGEKGVPRRI